MFVKLVIFIVMMQCVYSREPEARWSYYSPIPGNMNQQAQTIHFKYTLPNGVIMPQPHFYGLVTGTGQTGYQGIRPPNFHSISPNWNYQKHQFVILPQQQNNIVYHNPNTVLSPLPTGNTLPGISGQGFHQTLPIAIPLDVLDKTGNINVESLTGKFEDFVRPEQSNAEHIITYGPQNRPGYIQGGAQFHDTTRPEDTVSLTSGNKSLPEVTTNIPITNAQVTTAKPAIPQQEKDNINGDVQYDIDIRKDTE